MVGYLGLAVQNRNQYQALWCLKVAILWRLWKCGKCLSLILCLSKAIIAHTIHSRLNLAIRLLCRPKIDIISKHLPRQLINRSIFLLRLLPSRCQPLVLRFNCANQLPVLVQYLLLHHQLINISEVGMRSL